MNEWGVYTGSVEKEFYDIKLFDGRVFYECWPNAGTFHTGKGKVIHSQQVSYIRKSKSI